MKENKLHELNHLLLKKAQLALSSNPDPISNLANQASLVSAINQYEEEQRIREAKRKYQYDENGMDTTKWKRLTEDEARLRNSLYGKHKTHRNIIYRP